MRAILFCLSLLSTGCSYQSNSAGDSKHLALPQEKAVAVMSIPVSVQDHIARHLPGWTIPGPVDYAGSFWSFYDRSTVPYFTAVDINDDNFVDYGVLIKKQKKVQLVLLLSAGSDSFIHHIVSDPGKAPADITDGLSYCVLPEPPGQIDVAYPDIRSLILLSNGINLMDMENRVCIYYWDGSHISVFQTM